MLLKGKVKRIFNGSTNSALFAVEAYNKPRSTFRSETYIILMIIAWTRLFHAYFQSKIGNKYYYKKNNRYEKIDGERKAWDLQKCIIEFDKLTKFQILSNGLRKNLELFI